MSGLPPTGSNNKVSVRSKTSSFKRPMSCEVSESKKEMKGLFSKMRKGSSNSRLDEESQYRETPVIAKPNNNNAHEAKENVAVTRIQGRNFDSDDEDYELDCGETRVTKMEKLFSNNDKVVKNPALIGALLKYLICHSHDYYSLLFYLIVQHYKSAIQNKEFSKEALRFITEIYTTFLHDKSILKIEHSGTKAINFDDLKTYKDFCSVFDESSKYVFTKNIINSIQKVKTSIAHGLCEVDCGIETMSFDEKMNHFNSSIKEIVKSLEDKLPKEPNQNATKESKEQESYLSDINSAVKSSLATIYFYFSKKEKEENSDNISLVSSKFNSFIGKSTESLQMMTNCVLEKQPMFCAKVHKRAGSHSFFKKGKALKGHNFQEKIFDYPVDCLLCEKLLWGMAPQGFLCSHCQCAAHKYCKDFVRVNCQGPSKRYQRNLSYTNPPVEDDTNKTSSGFIDDHHVNSIANNHNNNNASKDHCDKLEIKENDDNKLILVDNEPTSEDSMQTSITTFPSDTSQSSKSNYVVSTATIIVTNNDDNSSQNNFDTESMDSISDINSFEKQDSTKSEFEKHDLHIDRKKHLSPSYVPAGHVRTMATKYDQTTIPRSQSENSIESSTLPRTVKRSSDSVHVQDLIQDTDVWSHDADMLIGETFEADKELEAFPEHLSKEVDKAEYTRLLVLMEFHHKTKFTVMTLKRYDYLLIKKWPEEDTLLFKTLSLNCIVPLYELIKMLVDTIESCRTKSTFTHDTARKVLDWLVSNEETNLQEWLKYSIDLCCTNSLFLVKNAWKDYRKSDPRYSHVLNKRFNKMVMVEQLSNMRPLLFNFPLIVNKLARDLSKYSKFKDETKIWKEIHEKFKLLPTFIDEHCMPLVQLINSGTIINGFDRTAWVQRLNPNDPNFDYIIDFPKTAFHYKLFDFQEIKISNFRESGNKIKTPAIFVKETCDAYAICYENILVMLQKENEKYVLKQFKATDSTKCNPILIVENVHTSKGEKKGALYELTMVFINVAVLTQVLFHKKDVMEKWHDFIYKIKNKNMKKTESFTASERSPGLTVDEVLDLANNLTIISDNNFTIHDKEATPDINSTDEIQNYQSDIVLVKYDTLKQPVEDYLSCLDSMKPGDLDDKPIFPNPSDPYEFLIGTTYDAGNLIMLCNESFDSEAFKTPSSISIKDEMLDHLISCLSNMQTRVTHFRNNRDKDTLSINDIDYEIPEINNHSEGMAPQSEDVSPPESMTGSENQETESIEREVHASENKPYQNEERFEDSDVENLIKDSNDQSYQDSKDEMASFVADFVNRIIENAQSKLNQLCESDTNSDINSNDQDDLLDTNQIPEPSA